MNNKRTRRNFTQDFKQEIVKQILAGRNIKSISAEKNILIPLLQRWVNDYIATQKLSQPTITPFRIERRRDYQTLEELKFKLAQLYMEMEQITKSNNLVKAVS